MNKEEKYNINKHTLNRITLEPKLENRFSLVFPTEFNLSESIIQTTNLPKYNNGKWSNIVVSFLDPIGPSTSQSLFKLIPIKKNIFNFLIRKKQEFLLKIYTLDPTGVEVEQWEISVKKIISFDFGDFSYYSTNIKFAKIELVVKDCKLLY